MLRELISEKEYEMLNKYRERYGLCDCITEPTVSIYEYLSSWENEKQDLFKLLGNNLILSKQFSFKSSDEDLENAMTDFLTDNSFKKTFYEVVGNELDNSDLKYRICELFYTDTLVCNKIFNSTIELKFNNNKSIKIVNGAKPMRIIKKLSEMFNIDGFEEFRIEHSQILNQKELVGNINLSIHPMDFWTLSDNDCGWSSCMSWMEDECYKRGTVATMHSPYVLVAYLSASKNMNIGRDYEWNNKKWRQLFIVNNGIVCSVKAYPYDNMNLTETVLKWIKELAKTNMNWEYKKEINSFKDSQIRNIRLEDSELYNIDFSCDPMYCDIGSSTHLYSIGSKIIDYTEYGKYIHIYYGGITPCICCGELEPYYEHEGQLICNDCVGYRCYHCDCLLNSDTAYWLNDDVFCQYCYRKHRVNCICCGDIGNKDYMSRITIVPHNIDKIKEAIPKFNENSAFYDSAYLYYDGYHDTESIEAAIKELVIDNSGYCRDERYHYSPPYYKIFADSLKPQVIEDFGFEWTNEKEYIDWLLEHNS